MDLEGGKVEFLWSSKEINSRAAEYWPLVMDIARRNKLPRIIRYIFVKGACCVLMFNLHYTTVMTHGLLPALHPPPADVAKLWEEVNRMS